MQAEYKDKLNLQHLWPGPGIAAVGGVKGPALETKGRKDSWGEGRDSAGQNRELTLGCSLPMVTLQEGFSQKWQEGSRRTEMGDGTGGRGRQKPDLWDNVSSSDLWSLGFPREEFHHLKILGGGGHALAPKSLP